MSRRPPQRARGDDRACGPAAEATHDAESHGTDHWLKKTPPTRYMLKSRAMRDLSAGRHLV